MAILEDNLPTRRIIVISCQKPALHYQEGHIAPKDNPGLDRVCETGFLKIEPLFQSALLPKDLDLPSKSNL